MLREQAQGEVSKGAWGRGLGDPVLVKCKGGGWIGKGVVMGGCGVA